MASVVEFLGAWTFDPFIAANLAAAAVIYAVGVRRVRRESPSDPWPWIATASFMTGIVLLAMVYLGPMAAWMHTFFWVHMTQHLVVMMAAAPLIVLGSPIALWFRASSSATRRRVILPTLRSRPAWILTDPVLTWVLFAVVLLGTHFTGFYDWALRNHDAAVFIEQPLFLAAATLFYLPMLGRNLLPRRVPASRRLISMSTMMAPEALVGAVIYFSPVVLYDTFARAERPFGPSALADQQLAGALMWALVMVIEAGWMMLIAVEWFSGEERRARRLDAQVARDAANQPGAVV